MMRIQSLAGTWEFHQADMDEWLPASVSGSVHTDLLALGCVPDPFVADNEARVQWVAESDWTMTSYIVEQHQKNASGISLMVRQMLDTFRLPKDFASLVYLSMPLQAEGIRYGVEHRVVVILYWQINGCCSVASWSSLDYFGRWKALHYATRHFYAPIMLSIQDNPPEQAVYVSNDWFKPWNGAVKWSLN
jgi:beta-galactosidase/beta-glucuronidase